MTNFARIVDGVAVDVSASPTQSYHPQIAAAFVSVPEDVRAGWLLVAGNWQAPAEPETPDPVPPKVSPVEFKLLFTPAERVAIKAATASDPVIADFFAIVDDPRLTFVDLGLQSTQDGLAYLVAQSLLAGERAAEILTGQLQ